MGIGVQYFDDSGNLRLDLGTDRVLKFFGVANIGNSYTGTATGGSIADARFSQYPNNFPFVLILSGVIDPDGYVPVITVSGGAVNWSYPRSNPGMPNSRPNTTFAYGVY